MFWVLIRIASSRRGDSNEYPEHMFLWRTDENYPSIIIKYPPYLFFWKSNTCKINIENVREAYTVALSSPSEVITMLNRTEKNMRTRCKLRLSMKGFLVKIMYKVKGCLKITWTGSLTAHVLV